MGKLIVLIYSCIVIYILKKAIASKILIIGGNGFLGNDLVRELLQQKHVITLLCRCNNYFDSDHEIIPHVNDVIRCDRNIRQAPSQCIDGIAKYTYDFLIDFSAFEPSHVEDLLQRVKKTLKLYVFISTVAVNDVLTYVYRTETYRAEITEEYLSSLNISNENPYAYNKLLCELKVKSMCRKNNLRCVIMRLPDVIGLRDTSFRIWHYQLLLNIHKQLNVKVPIPRIIGKQKFALAHVNDVTKSILNVLKKSESFSQTILNVSSYDNASLEKLISTISECLAVRNVTIETDEDIAWYKYPTNAQQEVTMETHQFPGFPTKKFEDAICEIVEFQDQAMTKKKYSLDRQLFLAEFIEESLPDNFDDVDLFISTLKDAYGDRVFEGIDVGLDERKHSEL